MTVKELKAYLDTFDDDLKVCILRNPGYSWSYDVPDPVKASTKEVQTYLDGMVKMLVLNSK